MIPFCDLCYANLEVDYQAMKATGISLVYIRLGQAGLGLDKMFKTHRAEIQKVGLPFGVYFFYDYFHYTPKTNAHYLADYITQAGDVGQAPPALDLEYMETLGWGLPSAASMLGKAIVFFSEVKALGLDSEKMLFWSNPRMFYPMQNLASIELLTKQRLAVSHWRVAAPWVLPWKTWVLWQREGDIKVPWAKNGVDTGYFNGDQAALNAFLLPSPIGGLPSRDACIDDMLKKAGYKWQS